MKKPYFLLIALYAIIQFSCSQSLSDIVGGNNPQPGFFYAYTIRQGNHTADYNPYVPVHIDQLNFVVRFDSSAIYQTTDPTNQVEINKLFGFADNDAHHHKYSARFGWNWSHGTLRPHAYVYNNGSVLTQEIIGVTLGTEYNCSIIVHGNEYLFSVNGVQVTMPRESTTHAPDGYKLFTYFGGDETAPHDIRIFIKEQ